MGVWRVLGLNLAMFGFLGRWSGSVGWLVARRLGNVGWLIEGGWRRGKLVLIGERREGWRDGEEGVGGWNGW